MFLSLSDCQHPGQPRGHAEPQVGARGFLHEHAEHRAAGAEVSPARLSCRAGAPQQPWQGLAVPSARSGLPWCPCRYRSGIRGHMKAVVMDLLRQYLKVETQFQHGEFLSLGLESPCGPFGEGLLSLCAQDCFWGLQWAPGFCRGDSVPRAQLKLRGEINALHCWIQAQDGNGALANCEALALTGSSDSTLLLSCSITCPGLMVLQIHFHFNLLAAEDGARLFAVISFWLSFE